MPNNDSVAKPKEEKPRKKWWRWLIFLLLPLAMYTPILGSNLQSQIVGSEHVCCMPDNLEELLEKAKIARSRRSESDAIMNGSMLGGAIILIVFSGLFYGLIWRHLGKTVRIVSGIIVGIVVMLILMWLLHLMEWYSANTDEYYNYAGWMQWPFV